MGCGAAIASEHYLYITTCSCSKTSAALLKNIAPAQLTLLENIAGVLLTFGKNVLRLW